MLWLVVFGRTVGLYATVGAWKVHMGVGDFLAGTQSLAVLEVVFALTGMLIFRTSFSCSGKMRMECVETDIDDSQVLCALRFLRL